MKKRIIAVLLALTLAAAPMQYADAGTVQAQETAAENEGFEIQDGVLVKYIGTASEVSVPDGVTKIGDSAFEGNTVITDVSFPDSVTEIGRKAFYGCTGLKEAILPKNLEKLGFAAFVGCRSLNYVWWPKSLQSFETNEEDYEEREDALYFYRPFSKTGEELSVEFEEGMVRIPDGCFTEVSNLKNVIIPDSVTDIGIFAFAYTGLTEVSVPALDEDLETSEMFMGCPLEKVELAEGTKVIYPQMFANTDIRSIVLPDSVERIGSNAFADCDKLEEIEWSEGLKEIDLAAFNYCSSLKEVILPETVEKIETAAFEECTSLKNICFSEKITEIPAYLLAGTGIEEITIPDTVTTIGEYAFKDCADLKKIVIPDSVTEIGAGILDGNSQAVIVCSEDSAAYRYGQENGIECVTEEKTEFEIQDGVLVKYTGTASEVSVPDGVTKIGDSAFEGNSTLTAVTFPDSVTEIGRHAFYDCDNLKQAVLPANLETLGFEAFADCGSLIYVWWPKTLENVVTRDGETEESIFGQPFDDTGEGLHIDFEDGTTYIPMCFSEMSNLQSVTIPDSVERIEYYAFVYSGLKEITLPVLTDDVAPALHGCSLEEIHLADGTKKIYGIMFEDTEITTLDLPDSVELIDNRAFRLCDKLETVYWSENLKEIGPTAFEGCVSLKEVILPENVEKIDAGAFRDCTGLTSLYIPASLKGVGAVSLDMEGNEMFVPGFDGCTSLKEVQFGQEITEIPAHLLEGTGIEEITIPDTVTKIGEYAFKDCTDLKKIIIPDSVTEIGEGILDGCSQAVIVCSEDSAAYQYAQENGLECIPDHVHMFGEWYTYREATCTADGEKRRECECGEYETEVIPKLGHSFGEWVTKEEATYYGEGKEVRTCERCGAAEERSIPRLEPDPEQHPDYALAKLQVVNALTLEAVPGATVLISSEQERFTVKTDENGQVEIFVPNGTYYFQIEKEDYMARGFEYTLQPGTVTLPQIGISQENLVTGNLTVTELTREEMEEIGIDPDAPGNSHVFRYEVEIRFEEGMEIYEIPFITIKDENGNKLKEYIDKDPDPDDDEEITDDGNGYFVGMTGGIGLGLERVKFLKVTDYMYIVIRGETKWTKEMFHVQLVVVNQSQTDTMENCVAELNLPEGLSLADLISGEQTAEADIGTIEKGGSRTVDWYIRGDKPGDFDISAVLKGEFAPFHTPFEYTFETQEPFHVYAGTDMKLTVHLSDAAYYGEPYTMIFELENVSDRTIYNVHHKIESVEQRVQYITVKDGFVLDPKDKESWDRLGAETLDENSEIVVDELKPDEKLAVLVETEILWKSPLLKLKDTAGLTSTILKIGGAASGVSWALGLLSYVDVRYYLSDMLVTTLEGSTAEIPVEFDIEQAGGVKIQDKIIKEVIKKLWGKGKGQTLKFIFGDEGGSAVGNITTLQKYFKTMLEVEVPDMDTEWAAWVETADGDREVISISADGAEQDDEGRLLFTGDGEISVEAMNKGEASLVVRDENGNEERYSFKVPEAFPGQEIIAGDLESLLDFDGLIMTPGSIISEGYRQMLDLLELDITFDGQALEIGDEIPTGTVIQDSQSGEEYTVVVPGDTNSDARINLFDSYQILNSVNDFRTLTDAQKKAANYTDDDKIDMEDAEYLFNYLTDQNINLRSTRAVTAGTQMEIPLSDITSGCESVRGVQIDILGISEKGMSVSGVSVNAESDFGRAVYNTDGDYIRAIAAEYEGTLNTEESTLLISYTNENDSITIPAKVYIQTEDDTIEKDMELTFENTAEEQDPGSDEKVEQAKEELNSTLEEYREMIEQSDISQEKKDKLLGQLDSIKSEADSAGEMEDIENLKGQLQEVYNAFKENEGSENPDDTDKPDGEDKTGTSADPGENQAMNSDADKAGEIDDGKKAPETGDTFNLELWLAAFGLSAAATAAAGKRRRKNQR